MKKLIFTLLATAFTMGVSAQKPISIARQGHFTVGGSIIQHSGTYDNSKFIG